MGMIASCLSNIMYLSEKVALYATCVGLISCLMLTFVSTLGMGIGLGYNYCYVDLKTRQKYVPAHYVYHGSPRWPKSLAAKREESAFETKEEQDDARDEELTKRITLDQSDQSVPPFKDINVSPLPEDDDDITRPMYYLSVTPENLNKTSTTVDKSTNVTLKSLEKINSYIPDNITDTTYEFWEDTNETTNGPSPTPTIYYNESNSRKVKKLVIPLSGLDLISLLSKLKDEKKNYSLQIVTT